MQGKRKNDPTQFYLECILLLTRDWIWSDLDTSEYRCGGPTRWSVNMLIEQEVWYKKPSILWYHGRFYLVFSQGSRVHFQPSKQPMTDLHFSPIHLWTYVHTLVYIYIYDNDIYIFDLISCIRNIKYPLENHLVHVQYLLNFIYDPWHTSIIFHVVYPQYEIL